MASAEKLSYLDSSAILKLVVAEPESRELQRSLLDGRAVASSQLAVAEVPRALRRIDAGHKLEAQVDSLAAGVLGRLALVPLERGRLVEAGALDEPGLRTLDAIHISSAASLGTILTAFVSYDRRQLDAAARAGLPVSSPGDDERRER